MRVSGEGVRCGQMQGEESGGVVGGAQLTATELRRYGKDTAVFPLHLELHKNQLAQF